MPVVITGAGSGPGGRLVLTASLAGLVTNYGYSSYSASKFGVIALADVLRMELRPRGIAVSAIAPPEVETPLLPRRLTHAIVDLVIRRERRRA